MIFDSLAEGTGYIGKAFSLGLTEGDFHARGHAAVYEIFRGVGSPLNIDWENPVAETEETQITLSGLTHESEIPYYYAVRKKSYYGVSDYNFFRIVEFETDELRDKPGRPTELICTPTVGGTFQLGFNYDPIPEEVAAVRFNAYEGPTVALIDYNTVIGYLEARRGQDWMTIATPAYAHGTTHWFVVRAVTAEGVEEKNVEAVSGVADAEAPDAIEDYAVR